MHDEAWIALNFRDVAPVVMDAMAIEGERGIAEQQHIVRRDAAVPGRAGFRSDRRWHWVTRLGRSAVDDVVLFGQRKALGIGNLVLDQHKHQITRAARLVRDGFDARGALHRIAHQQGVVLFPPQTPARPHTARQRHRGQKAAARRVAVGPETALAHLGQKIKPVP